MNRSYYRASMTPPQEGKPEFLETTTSPDEHYSKVLQDFHTYDPSSPFVKERSSSGSGRFLRKERARILSPGSINSGDTKSPHGSRDSMRSRSTTVNSSISSQGGDDFQGTAAMEAQVRNEALERENSRLKKKLHAMEKEVSKSSLDTDTKKLNRKCKSLKAKCKEERNKTMQMGKAVEAHHAEIEGLRRELSKSLDKIEELERDKEADRVRIEKLNEELKEQQQNEGSAGDADKLESELRQRNDDLEVALELLQTKVERIVELEGKLELAKDKSPQLSPQSRCSDSKKSMDTSVLCTELQKSQSECKTLKRQNMMLKLLLKEVEGSRKKIQCEIDMEPLIQRAASSDAEEKQDESILSLISVDSSSTALAEELFQKEIERFNLEGSNSSFSGNERPSPRKRLEL